MCVLMDKNVEVFYWSPPTFGTEAFINITSKNCQPCRREKLRIYRLSVAVFHLTDQEENLKEGNLA